MASGIPASTTGEVTVDLLLEEGAYHAPEGYIYILQANNMLMEGGVITTDSFMGPYDSDIYGFAAELPATGPIAGGIATIDYTAGTTDEANIGEEGSSLIRGSIGLGYIPATTWYKGYYSQAKLFFNYSNMSREASFRVDDAEMYGSPGEQRYHVETSGGEDDSTGPVTYYAAEKGALQNKFGFDETLSGGTLEATITGAILASVEEMTELLVTTFPMTKQTFKRTKPLKIYNTDVNSITEAGTLPTSIGVSPTSAAEEAAAATEASPTSGGTTTY
jgi:hypothetical protein